eukprot:CAMPEP_0201613934 /NCGR_PEP_ID=MMETSP0492-20130828/27320_1 /ASSEMBLY_ACC=CAM_ASM_000837 /TAXON_ID=420259 /ORGANISM="Thalassiosira gravida, Strain GMp14c1" /LENGTH=258 /DNA_ID=CAMNT_0048081011 /DNA_START=42 /DNA_END=818 /DNA_ORIENTATION=-
MTSASLLPLLCLCLLALSHSFSTPYLPDGKYRVVKQGRLAYTSTTSLFVKDKWDLLIDEEEDDDLQFDGGPPVPRDMKYNMFNINRQREHFVSIKGIAGKDLTNDVYARDPETDTFWFIGKVARVSDIPIEKCIARQWAMVEEHSARLRPTELYPKWGSLQLWAAPGDSEVDVAYCRPEIQFIQMFRDVDGSSEVRNMEVGFQGELYENEEEGFRTIRTDDGKAVKQEIQSSPKQPTEAQLDEMMKVLNDVEANSGEQ